MWSCRLMRTRVATNAPLRRSMKTLTSSEIRTKFLNYFEHHQHTRVPSASIIPHNDKTLLFTNAGMVPFKEHFLKPESAPFKSATSLQKVIRAGGKHNDLDNVGYTTRHHTFFEMLGNFSFGRYDKTQAIKYAWDFLRKELEMPVDRLRVTVLNSDKESYDIWKNVIGLPEDQIIPSTEEDNFWSMGDGEGPCGPCSEIFWDTRDMNVSDDERWLEVWNLVFMQNFRHADGTLSSLPTLCIDTGMGLERMARVLQSKENNFQIDQFQSLVDGIRDLLKSEKLPHTNDEDPSVHEKIIADHLRSMSFMIGDGIIPSNVGRGYVLRRIIRRALRSGRQLGFKEPFLTRLYPYLTANFGTEWYPELSTRAETIQNIIQSEETIFFATLEKGLGLLESVFEQPKLQDQKEIPAETAFKLYDTYGFPLDLTVIIAAERGWHVDLGEVEKLQDKQRSQGRESWKGGDNLAKGRLSEWRNQNIFPEFTGYDHSLLHQESQIVAVDVDTMAKTPQVLLSIDPCPFYGMGGGQVPDAGSITLANGQEWDVVDVFQPYEGGLAMRIQPKTSTTFSEQLLQDEEFLMVGNLVKTNVDKRLRQGAEIHHTATHLLNAGLRRILQADVVQAGSAVEPARLRFDFTYGKPVSSKQLQQIEDWINEVALTDAKTKTRHFPLQKAIDAGAIAVFSEKYSDLVRVVEVPEVTKELCGGTHVTNLRQLYPFKIVSESSVAAGTRRIEAIAGPACIEWYRNEYRFIPPVLNAVRANSSSELGPKVDKLSTQLRDTQRQLTHVTDKLAQADPGLPVLSTLYKDHKVKIHQIDASLDGGFMLQRANYLKEHQNEDIHVLVSNNTVMVAVNAKSVRDVTAQNVLKQVLTNINGKGGGKNELAQARLLDNKLEQSELQAKVIESLGE
ncbi:alanyl-tRNA synthetase [Umbelopsis sp. AD052]|nr:alanyl-tRNA synthetase [Umbelopsis sp. AD052]